MTLNLKGCKRKSHRSIRADGFEVGLKMVSNGLSPARISIRLNKSRTSQLLILEQDFLFVPCGYIKFVQKRDFSMVSQKNGFITFSVIVDYYA